MHTHTYHHNTHRNREIYKTKTPHLYPCQNIAPHASNKLQKWTSHKAEKDPASNSLLPTHAGAEKTPGIHTHVVERFDKMSIDRCVYTPCGMVTSIYPGVKNTCHTIYNCMHWRTKITRREKGTGIEGKWK